MVDLLLGEGNAPLGSCQKSKKRGAIRVV